MKTAERFNPDLAGILICLIILLTVVVAIWTYSLNRHDNRLFRCSPHSKAGYWLIEKTTSPYEIYQVNAITGKESYVERNQDWISYETRMTRDEYNKHCTQRGK